MRRIPSAAALPALALLSAAVILAARWVGGEPPAGAAREIVYDLRLGRAVLAFLVGASLAVSGATFQGLFRNPLADPFVVGVSGGAALGAVAAAVLGAGASLFGLGSRVASAFAGGLGAAFLGYQLARVRGRVPVSSLLLAGFAISSFTGALLSILLFSNQRSWHEVIAWLMGNTFPPDPWSRVRLVLPCAAAAIAVLASFARDLDLLLFGEESARQLGVEAERVKLALLGAGAVATAAAVAACGMIGFVGLIVPHVVRGWTGPRHRALLPVTVLAGGVLLTLAHLAARMASPEVPLPVGAVTALAGAPFFVYLLRRRAVRT